MAIKRRENGKWSVKGSNKYIVYKRVIDLTKEDKEVLKNYNLKKATYYYIGKCGEAKIDDRHNKFKWDVLNKTKGNKNVHIYLETAITYQNILKFFIEHKGLTKKEAEDYVFRSKECFKIYKEGLTEKEAEIEEKRLHHSYLAETKFNDKIILLKNKDSQIYVAGNSIKLKKSRKQSDFNAPSIELTYKNNNFHMKFNDNEYKINLMFKQINPKNDILEEEKLNIGRKKPSINVEVIEGI